MRPRNRLPPVFGTAELALCLGWSTQRVRRWCRRRRIGRNVDEGHRIEITYSDLLERDPDVYYALLAAGVLEVALRAD